uniref:Ovule protein n=1 Tax=Panagrellus redivivus TaxID=6233 RepID=A0A7E4UTU1_PANRE
MLINYISEVAPFTSSLRYKLKKDQNCQRRRQRYRTKPTPTHQEYHASKIRSNFTIVSVVIEVRICVVLF